MHSQIQIRAFPLKAEKVFSFFGNIIARKKSSDPLQGLLSAFDISHSKLHIYFTVIIHELIHVIRIPEIHFRPAGIQPGNIQHFLQINICLFIKSTVCKGCCNGIIYRFQAITQSVAGFCIFQTVFHYLRQKAQAEIKTHQCQINQSFFHGGTKQKLRLLADFQHRIHTLTKAVCKDTVAGIINLPHMGSKL